ncbi:enoyl-CoA hydratase/isomerase family protein [Amycolatopsis thermophila]|uniref:2-(1,2-epoxy-1,2-dihydrophenyl)acetyl-CoA isomerase n=1 Tax=Amycolatopsis thermophila TaxID=206084 RepID=A0ABU0ELZ9_9PSEU|nr:enoyl-CoA hydratase-related protein [Amycolatopsis thermophila]MDQ0376209.1 2-(1,2-epoxy-1,2-dihydrophenyl)acetyl-CoA isomerase [Amycolatopsis thermophila]
MTEEDPVLVSRAGAVATVTINRPHRKNAIDLATWDGLLDAFRETERDDAVRVVVVTGADGDFSAGADLGAERGGHPLTAMHRVNDVALALNEITKPTIAKVDGVAVGAGWNLALGCDFVVASERARFSQIFAKRGLSLDFGGSWLLPRLVGMQQAKRLALRAEMIDAAQARELGLVTWVKPAGELDSFVDELAAELAAAPPIALALSKKLLEEGASRTLREALEGEARAQAVNFATEDAPAAFEAFLGRTEAKYTGRWAVR